MPEETIDLTRTKRIPDKHAVQDMWPWDLRKIQNMELKSAFPPPDPGSAPDPLYADARMST